MQKKRNPLGRRGLRGLKSVLAVESINLVAAKVKRRVLSWAMTWTSEIGMAHPGWHWPHRVADRFLITLERIEEVAV